MRLKKCRGFTLVEVMASVLIGAIAFSGMALCISSGYFTGTDSRNNIYAENAIREQLETIRRTSYDTVVGYGASSSFSNAQTAKIPGVTATRTIANGSGADIKKITLTVSWSSRGGRAISHSIVTNFTRKGLNGS